jgi:hypothetical protein
MIPPFYLGVAVCDLYKQELAVSAEEEVRWFSLGFVFSVVV